MCRSGAACDSDSESESESKSKSDALFAGEAGVNAGSVSHRAVQTVPAPAIAQVLVVGLVRNASGKIDTDVQRLRRALGSFMQVHWLLIESDSTDGTVEELQQLVDTVPRFRFLSLGQLQPQMPLRTQRIAHCRNAYLEALDQHADYADVDLVLMADFDGINTLVDEAAILSCWAREDWDVCTANQAGPYYDIWALRHALWSPGDCKSSYLFLVDHGVDPERALQATVLTRMITIPVDSPWIAVDSAFGGLGIYRRELLRGLRYIGLAADGHEVCEHVSMHAQIRSRGGMIFINPAMVCAGANEHTRTLRLSQKLHRFVRTTAKRLLVILLPGRFSNTSSRRLKHDAG